MSAAGCYVHPIVDDVSPIPSENIIASARCELRLGLVLAVGNWFKDVGITDYDPNFLADDLPGIERRYGRDPAWVERIRGYKSYLAIAVAYDWNFDIIETNGQDANVGFQIPYLNAGSFGVSASQSLHKTRQAKRAFKTGEKSAATTGGTADGNKALQVQIQLLQAQTGPSGKDAQDVHRLSALWQARFNLCVQDGRSREDQLNALRFTAPEVYCIEYADAFVPRAGQSGRIPFSYSRAGR